MKVFSEEKNSVINEKLFKKIFDTHYLVLREYANFYVGNSAIAEDIVQDVFFKLWNSRSEIIFLTSYKAYLYRSVHNSCIQHLRHEKVKDNYNKDVQLKLREAGLMSSFFSENSTSRLFEKEINELIDQALKKLPAKTKEIYILSRKQKIGHKDIALQLNLSEKSIEYHLTKALKALRYNLKDYLP